MSEHATTNSIEGRGFNYPRFHFKKRRRKRNVKCSKTRNSNICNERAEQIVKHGWTVGRDDEYTTEQLAAAATAYLVPFGTGGHTSGSIIDELWPADWDLKWLKRVEDPTREERIEELAIAGALIAAEIDRLNRLDLG